MPGWLLQPRVRLLPYPGGAKFAFTIVDDTDGATLETVRPIYDYLATLGLKTTKTVWVRPPGTAPENAADAGDTLEREAYASYIRLLRRRGFEIALHNVSSKSSTRSEIAGGLERYRLILGESPRINVHHEKNLENLYFSFAQRGQRPPTPFRTAAFRRLEAWLHRNGAASRQVAHACSGEDRRSQYFWGDLCKATIQYVRSNVFFRDLNTLKINPLIPYRSAETPLVNYWFDSSNGQDAACFNAILSDDNIERLRTERGCSILYTHFGKGFVANCGGSFQLNTETRRRLLAISGHPEGWYAPAGQLLDRLLAFQQITMTEFPGGFALVNGNNYSVPSITLEAEPSAVYRELSGQPIQADWSGRIVLPSLGAGQITLLTVPKERDRTRCWYEEGGAAWLADVRQALRKVREHMVRRV